MTKTGKLTGKLFLGLSFLLTAVTTTAYAEEISLLLNADKTEASLEDTISVDVVVQGSQSAPQPILTHASDFDVQVSGSSSSIQIINGQISTSKSFRFLLTPKKPGQFNIGPAEVGVKGKPYQSNTLALAISQSSPPPNVPANPQNPREPNTGRKSAFVEAEVNQPNPYVGEQVVYTFRFYSQIPVRNAELKAPEFEGFWKESLGDTKNYQRVIDGQNWQVNEIRWALFPMKPGPATVDAAKLTAEISVPSRRDPLFSDPFFGNFFQETQRKVFSASPIELNVKPLPSAGKPDHFSGLVGDFHMAVPVPKGDWEIGQSSTLTVEVQGDGNLRDVQNLEFQETPEFKDNFKVYDDQPELKLNPTGQGLNESKTFRKALIPLREGDVALPPVTLNYFDPKLGQYQTLSTGPLNFQVRPSKHPEALNNSGNKTSPEIQKKSLQGVTPKDDLISIEAGASALKNDAISLQTRRILLPISFLSLLLFIVVWYYKIRQEKMLSSIDFRRRQNAFKDAISEIKKLESNSKANSENDFYENTIHILKDFIGKKSHIDERAGRALTAADMSERLSSFKLSEETQKQLTHFLNISDAGLYGGNSLAPEKKKSFIQELQELIERLEKEITA